MRCHPGDGRWPAMHAVSDRQTLALIGRAQLTVLPPPAAFSERCEPPAPGTTIHRSAGAVARRPRDSGCGYEVLMMCLPAGGQGRTAAMPARWPRHLLPNMLEQLCALPVLPARAGVPPAPRAALPSPRQAAADSAFEWHGRRSARSSGIISRPPKRAVRSPRSSSQRGKHIPA